MDTEKKIEAPTEPVLVSVGTWNFQKPDSKEVTFRIPRPTLRDRVRMACLSFGTKHGIKVTAHR